MYTKLLNVILALVVSMGVMTSATLASEITGTITTGVGTGVGGVVISSPLYTPAASTFVTSTSVSLSAPSATAICYRADLVDPTCPTAVSCGAGDTLYTGAIPLTSTTTLKARACFPGDGGAVAMSSVSTATYTLATPTVGGGSSGGGSGGGSQTGPFISPILPVNTGKKPLNQTVICRAADSGNTLVGISATSGKIYINGQLVPTVSTPITTMSGLVTLLEMSYTPTTNLYPDNTTVNVLCAASTVNGAVGTNTFQFDAASTGVAEIRAGGGQIVTTTGSGTTVNSGSGTTVSNFFTDTTGHWAEQIIESLHTECQVNGYTDHTGRVLHLFKPQNDISRAELITMLMRCKYGAQIATGTRFTDVAQDHWANAYIEKASSLGIVKGYTTPDGKKVFSPNQSATRAEALKMILLTFFQSDDIAKAASLTLCTDVSDDAWYKTYFNYAVGGKIVTGYLDGNGKPTGMCKPLHEITRAESAALIIRAKNTL